MLALFTLATVPAAIAAQEDEITGTWTGTFNSTGRCGNGVPRSDTGDMLLALSRNGSCVIGAATIEGPILNDACQVIGHLTAPLPITGTITGNVLTATIQIPFAVRDESTTMSLTGILTTNTLNVTFSDSEMSGSASLGHTNTSSPVDSLSGSYFGTYAIDTPAHDSCPALAYSAASRVSLAQAGSSITGLLVLDDTKNYDIDSTGICRLHETVQQAAVISGIITGQTVDGFLFGMSTTGDLQTDSIPFTGSLDANAFTATTRGSTSPHISFSVARTSPQPQLLAATFSVHTTRPKRRAEVGHSQRKRGHN